MLCSVAMWDGTGERAKSAPIDAKLPPYGASLPVKFWREFFNYFDVDHGEIREGAWLACLGLVVQVYHETPEVKSRGSRFRLTLLFLYVNIGM